MNTVKNIKPESPALVKVDANSVFGDVFTKGEAGISVFNSRTDACLKSNPNYVPDASLVRMFVAWQQASRQPLCFGLHGNTGTGKTEFLMYVADKMNLPVALIQCHGSLMPEDLEGINQLKNGETHFQLGALLQAYKEGGLIILDELDKLNEAAGAFLHGILEGKPITVAQTGETIEKHPHCWISATGNTVGEGGHVIYTSSNQMDAALRSRIGWVRVKYPDMARELEILTVNFGKLIPRQMLRDVVRVGNLLRVAAFGEDEEGTDTPVGVICSTRTLVNWVFFSIRFGKSSLWQTSFDYAIGGSIDPESKDEVMAIVQRQLGNLLQKPLEEVLEHYKPKKG